MRGLADLSCTPVLTSRSTMRFSTRKKTIEQASGQVEGK